MWRRGATLRIHIPESRLRQHTHHGGGGGLAAGAAGGVVRRHRARQHLRQLERAGGEDGDEHALRQAVRLLQVRAMALGLW